MKNYTSNEFLEVAEYDEELNIYFIEADGEDITITISKDDAYRNYGLRGDKAGSITVTGDGSGWAYRAGSGEGSSYRYGSGKGSAYRIDSGNGSAYRIGSGTGSAFRDGSGSGDAYRAGSGEGSSYRYGSGKGSAYRIDSGNGSAYRIGSGTGSAFRDGSGEGSAFIEVIEIKSEEDYIKCKDGEIEFPNIRIEHSEDYKIKPVDLHEEGAPDFSTPQTLAEKYAAGKEVAFCGATTTYTFADGSTLRVVADVGKSK